MRTDWESHSWISFSGISAIPSRGSVPEPRQSGSVEAVLKKGEGLAQLPACPPTFPSLSFQSQMMKVEPMWMPPRCGGKTENNLTRLPSRLCRSHLDFKLTKRLQCFVFLSTWKRAVLSAGTKKEIFAKLLAYYFLSFIIYFPSLFCFRCSREA